MVDTYFSSTSCACYMPILGAMTAYSHATEVKNLRPLYRWSKFESGFPDHSTAAFQSAQSCISLGKRFSSNSTYIHMEYLYFGSFLDMTAADCRCS